ncbi:hypothetical protein FOCC_FOCC017276, partial [Frankliniella occidentalis]
MGPGPERVRHPSRTGPRPAPSWRSSPTTLRWSCTSPTTRRARRPPPGRPTPSPAAPTHTPTGRSTRYSWCRRLAGRPTWRCCGPTGSTSRVTSTSEPTPSSAPTACGASAQTGSTRTSGCASRSRTSNLGSSARAPSASTSRSASRSGSRRSRRSARGSPQGSPPSTRP